MTDNRPLATWLRTFAGLIGLTGLLALGACGGGSGAPNNSFKGAGTLAVSPATAVVYSGAPTAFTISGGVPPYQAFSSNAAVVPVTQAVAGSTVVVNASAVAADTPVTLTVRDSSVPNLTFDATLTARSSTLLNSLTITPNNADCGTNAICSGQNGTASVKALGPEGAPLAGRSIRFDVVAGPFAIVTTSPGQPTASTLNVTTDQNGTATALILANVNAPTQFAQIRATDVTTGQQVTGSFLIQQVTDGSKVLTVVPSTAKITMFYNDECSSGFATDYYIYGGTPPYRVNSTFPTAVTVVNSVVAASGGFFRTITNGTCFDPNTYTIVDAVGLQTTATESNVVGSNARTTVTPANLVVTPSTLTDPACTGKTFTFIVSGGTPPYNVTPQNGVVNPQTIAAEGGKTLLSGLLTGSGDTQVVFIDSSAPKKSITAKLTCS